MDCKIKNSSPLGSKNTNAQVHPRMFCETLCELMKDKLTIKYGVVSRMVFAKSNQEKVVAVEYIPNTEKPANDNNNDDNNNDAEQKNNDNDACQGSAKWEEIECDAVLIALGPWSKQAFQWFPECKQLQYISGRKANSIVIQPTFGDKSKAPENENDVDVEMKDDGNDDKIVDNLDGQLFLKHTDKNGDLIDIEVYPRPDGSVYSCCHSNKIPLPDDPSIIKNEEKDSQMIYQGLKELSSKYMLNSKIKVKQACYLPDTSDSIPLIGEITGYENAFVGTGHTCWGILNGPATGLVLAELIADGEVRSVKHSAFKKWSPSRN